MIAGLGTDIVEIGRVAGLLDRHGREFAERHFTAHERDYCDRFKRAAERYAGRWAAKEAVVKALGTGFVPGVRWLEIEVRTTPSGKPELVLSGETLGTAAARGVGSVLVTISHGKDYATATAIALAAGSPTPPVL